VTVRLCTSAPKALFSRNPAADGEPPTTLSRLIGYPVIIATREMGTMGRRLGLTTVAILLGLGLALSGLSAAADPCLKLVFGRYCLGGDVNPLLQTAPAPLTQEVAGKSLALVFAEDVDQVFVLAYGGRIYKVLRSYRVATQLRFEEIQGLLVEKYGQAEDQSRFPDYASTPGRRLIAIRRGEGGARQVWRPATTWRIELTWTRELGLSLAYIADALEAERAAQLGRGL